MSSTPAKSWQLVADIGGTNARFARKQPGENRLLDITSFNVAGHENFTLALSECLATLAKDPAWEALPSAACFAVACRVDHEQVRFTNSPWHFTRTEVADMLGQIAPILINDFAAKGYAIQQLQANDWVQVGGQKSKPEKPVAILGPGTGLGVSLLVPTHDSFVVVDGEGGHMDFAPVSTLEYQILDRLAHRFGRVSLERLLCGAGLVNIYQALSEISHRHPALTRPEDISRLGQSGDDDIATSTLKVFCSVLGSVAGNLALTAGTLGGVYVTGGIIPGMLAFLKASDFRQRFEAKGRFQEYLSQIPVRVVTRQDLGLLGSANRLTQDRA